MPDERNIGEQISGHIRKAFQTNPRPATRGRLFDAPAPRALPPQRGQPARGAVRAAAGRGGSGTRGARGGSRGCGAAPAAVVTLPRLWCRSRGCEGFLATIATQLQLNCK